MHGGHGEGGREREWEREDVEKILKVISSEFPKLVDSILNSIKEILEEFYSPEKVKMRADAFIAFYKALVDNGVPTDEAIKLAKTQLIDINTIIEKALSAVGSRRRETY
ncbi:hypothetical protein DRN84_04190 [Candidatus Geothermarchaeota archaeon]|nr:MAG: hypothetical protein DRN87_05480 [Candidatus Geothermarchaeota archaeon]RLG60835.1 MAG: hypothetical protein DRN84_04190 [Candidatus Geothermarchaeota archaeon]